MSQQSTQALARSGGASTKHTLRMNCRANICRSGSTHLGEWLGDAMLSCWKIAHLVQAYVRKLFSRGDGLDGHLGRNSVDFGVHPEMSERRVARARVATVTAVSRTMLVLELMVTSVTVAAKS